MRIKQLKLSGFKSFANKTTINFNENFIGVVGPNGSGKSNVIDAIRWVFGEKSNKKMRGNNSADVIFGGTEKRKRQNICEVTIVLDNSDHHLEIEFDEVAFTRRLYRNGKSEYLINGVEVRYKDVQELILDKGIGKNAFSIISQGQIEEIITTTPEKRRLIVEEVAGILKYKKRKENSLNKLAKTDENLNQIATMLDGIEERRGPLKRQAENAQKFLSLKEELETKEISLLANRIQRLNKSYEEYKLLSEDTQLEIMQLETKEVNLSLNEEELMSLQTENVQKLNQINTTINDNLQKISQRRSDLKVLSERQSLLAGHSGRVLELKNNILHLKENLSVEESNLAKAKSALEIANVKERELYTDITDIQAKLKQLGFKENDLSNELNKIIAPFTTRKVLAANLPGIIGTVNESFSVDARYTEAISAILGGRIYDVITIDKEAASSAIKYLSQNKFGRQTFLPRDSMRTLKVDNDAFNIAKETNGFVGVASELIEFSKDNFNVFSNLLGNVIVCENLNQAKQLSNKINKRYRVVTLDGDIIQTSGAMSGGKSKRQSKLVLEAKLAKLQTEKQHLELSLENVTEKYDQFKTDFFEKRSDFEMKNTIVKRLKSELELNELEFNQFDSSQDDVSESNKIVDDISELEKILDELNYKQAKLEQTQSDNVEKIDEIREQLKNYRYQIKDLSSKNTQNNLQLERITINLKSDVAVLRDEYNMSTDMAISKAISPINEEEYDQIVKQIKSKIRNLGPVNTLAIDEYAELTERFNFIDEQRSDLIVAKNKLEDIIMQLDEFFIESFEDTYNKLRVEFQFIYKELFGGGNADLILTNSDDLLETGVEIVAQPPGKKLQTISLLSGGEKALTAIALLFAILRIKSLPFAILDEVEAALDEANVQRYAKYIKIFSEKTQFIVITHRQGTMENVDALYGVTMEEKGVSKTLKVSLQEGEKYA